LPDIAAYAAAREERPGLEPLPHLFVVIDEFGEQAVHERGRRPRVGALSGSRIGSVPGSAVIRVWRTDAGP
ncbi:hypothetical protein, partial [Streptomyces microflavus]|uniref:hypothetical protein n=1 Tax=Streptomyces microflavus TaxID=1919 RepID=UPI0035D70B83